MTNEDRELCGEECADGTPCENYADSCPWHGSDDPPEAGRPSKLTRELQERLAGDLEAGVPVKHAAPANGISEDTFYRWVRLGDDQDEGVFSEFSERVTRARAHGTGSILRDAVTIAREERDPRALLKAYAQIEGGKGDGGEDLAGLNLVVPEVAVRDDDE